MPFNADDFDGVHILVDEEFSRFICHPIIFQKEHPEAPSWCVAFVDLLKYIFQFKEWVHTRDKQTNGDFEQGDLLNFLIYTDTLLDILGLVKTQMNTKEESEHDIEQSSDDSFSHHSDGT